MTEENKSGKKDITSNLSEEKRRKLNEIFGVEERHFQKVRKETNNLTSDYAVLGTGTNREDCTRYKIAAEQLGYNVEEPRREFTDDKGYPYLYNLRKRE